MSIQNQFTPEKPGDTPKVLRLLKQSFAAPFANLPSFVAHAALPILLLYLFGSRTLDLGDIDLPRFLAVIPNFQVIPFEFLAFGLFLAGWYRDCNGVEPVRFGPFSVFLSSKTLIFLLAFACIFLAQHVLNGTIRLVLMDFFPAQSGGSDPGILPGPLFSSLFGFGAVSVFLFVVSSGLPRAAEGDPTWFSQLAEIIAGRVQFVAAIGLSIYAIDFFFVGFGLNAILRIFKDPALRLDVLVLLLGRFYLLAVAAAALSRIAFPDPEDEEEDAEGDEAA